MHEANCTKASEVELAIVAVSASFVYPASYGITYSGIHG